MSNAIWPTPPRPAPPSAPRAPARRRRTSGDKILETAHRAAPAFARARAPCALAKLDKSPLGDPPWRLRARPRAPSATVVGARAATAGGRPSRRVATVPGLRGGRLSTVRRRRSRAIFLVRKWFPGPALPRGRICWRMGDGNFLRTSPASLHRVSSPNSKPIARGAPSKSVILELFCKWPAWIPKIPKSSACLYDQNVLHTFHFHDHQTARPQSKTDRDRSLQSSHYFVSARRRVPRACGYRRYHRHQKKCDGFFFHTCALRVDQTAQPQSKHDRDRSLQSLQ